MFDGEYASLKAISSTKTIKCPSPHIVVDNPSGGAVIVMEYINMLSLNKQSELFGEQLAKYVFYHSSSRIYLYYHIWL